MQIEEKINEFLEEDNSKLPKDVANDPLYMAVINAKNDQEAEEAMKKLISVRGKEAVNVLKRALKQAGKIS